MTNHVSVLDGVVRVAPRPAEPAPAQPPSAPGRIPVLAILTDPAVVRIAVLAVGLAALLLAIATVL